MKIYDDDDISRMQECFHDWMEVRREFTEWNGILNWADICKSRLLGWMLLTGNKPLDVPPPMIMSGGWYELIEDGKAYIDGPGPRNGVSSFITEIILEPPDFWKERLENFDDYVIVGNHPWVVLDRVHEFNLILKRLFRKKGR